MANSLQPLQPIGGAPLNSTFGQTMGMTPAAYADLRRRQTIADALTADAKGSTSADSMFGAIGQGLKGYVGASMQQQNTADLASLAQSSPLAAQSLGYGQPAQPSGLGTIFGRLGTAFGFGGDTDSGTAAPPNPRADVSTTSWPQREWGE